MLDTRVGVRKRCRLPRSNLEAGRGCRHRHPGRSFGTPGLCPCYNVNQVTLITIVTVWEIQSPATVFASRFVTRGQVVRKLSQLLRLSEVQANQRMSTLLLLSMLQTLKFLYG